MQLASFLTFSQGTWTQRADWKGIDHSEFTHGNFVWQYNGKAYVGQGAYDSRHIYEYNQTTDTWIEYDTVPEMGNDGRYFYYNGIGYYLEDNIYNGAFWRYDIQNKVWLNIYNKLTLLRASLNLPYFMDFHNYAAPTWGTKAYIFDVRDTTGMYLNGFGSIVNATFEFDMVTESFSQKNSCPAELGHRQFTIADTIYNFAGSEQNYTVRDSGMWAYYPLTDAWQRLPGVRPYWSALSTAFSYNGKGYYGMGVTSYDHYPNDTLKNVSTQHFYEYDPAQNSWTQMADYPKYEVWDEGIGFELNGRLYMGLGDNDPGAYCCFNYLNYSFYEFSPAVTSISQIDKKENQLNIFYDETMQQLMVNTDGKKQILYTINNALGQLCMSGTLTSSANVINVSDWKSGLYFFITDNGQSFTKFVLNK